jgi:DNA-binding XRE family transcriptional regulator
MNDTTHSQGGRKRGGRAKSRKILPDPGGPFDPLYAVFALNLRQARRRIGLKLEAAVTKLGVSKSTWSQWEAGRRFPSGTMLAAIAKTLGIPPCMLLRAKKAPCMEAPFVHKA